MQGGWRGMRGGVCREGEGYAGRAGGTYLGSWTERDTDSDRDMLVCGAEFLLDDEGVDCKAILG